MVNEIQLKFINKLFEDNLLFFKTKITNEHLTDPFVKVMFYEIGRALRDYGELIPAKHLKSLVEDETRMDKFKKLKYPLELTSVSDIINYIANFKTETKFSTLEKTIMNDYVRTEMTYLAEEMLEDVCDSKKSIRDVIRKYSYSIDNLKYNNEDNIEFLSASDIIQNEKKRLLSDDNITYNKCGFKFIDDISGGVVAPATVYMVAAPATGKSIFLYDATVRALRSGKKVLFATIEIPTQEAYLKILSNFTGIKYHTILKKEFTEIEKEKYEKGLIEFEKYKDNLYMIYDKTGLSPSDIKHYYKTLEKTGIKCDFICIDYLGLMSSDDAKHSDVEKYTNLPKQVRVLSQETDSIVLIPHQLKTQQATKDINDLTPDSVFYAKTISHEATLAYFMTRDRDNGDITLIKNFKSRIGECVNTYVFRNADRNYCRLGEDEIFTNIAW